MKRKLPGWIIYLIPAVSFLPLLLCLFQSQVFNYIIDHQSIGEKFFTYYLLEWTATIVALLVVAISIFRLRMGYDLATLVLSATILFSGVTNTLVALTIPPGEVDFISLSFVQANSRLITSLLLVTGIVLVSRPKVYKKLNLKLISLLHGFLAATAILVVYVSHKGHVAGLLYSTSFIKELYDVFPLGVYAIGAFLFFSKYYKRENTFFTYILIIATIPLISSEIIIVFFSSKPFDDSFYFTIILKVIAYLIPFIGLMLDYAATHKAQELAKHRLRVFAQALSDRTETLAMRNNELDEFNYIISHDLKAPLRAINTLVDWISKDLPDGTDEIKENFLMLKKRTARMNNYITGILEYSKVGKKEHTKEHIDLNETVHSLVDSYVCNQRISINILNKLPTIYSHNILWVQLFGNLISNSLKHSDKEKVIIDIDVCYESEKYIFHVKDNGPGIPENAREKIFQIFQTLKPRDETENTGVGLSIVRKIVNNWGGSIQVKNNPNDIGCWFEITLPKQKIS